MKKLLTQKDYDKDMKMGLVPDDAFPFAILLELASGLEIAHLNYSMLIARSDAVMFRVSVPGERWEIEVFEDGHMEIERFRSDGQLHSEEALAELWALAE